VLLLRHCLLQLYSSDPLRRFEPVTAASDRCKSWTHVTLDHPFHSLPTPSAPLPPQLPASHSRDSYPLRKTKPTKDSHSLGGLVHCTVYPVFAALQSFPIPRSPRAAKPSKPFSITTFLTYSSSQANNLRTS